MKPLGYYADVRSDHPDSDILDRITEEFGSQLEGLTRDDKAAVLICLVDTAIDPQQVLIQENFMSWANGGELWHFARTLTPATQLSLALAIANQLVEEQE